MTAVMRAALLVGGVSAMAARRIAGHGHCQVKYRWGN
jgi:hypothetical protein